MFIAITTVFLLAIYQCQCLMNATVILHPPSSPLNVGKLVFTQDTPDSPVQINGSIITLDPFTTHGFHIHTNPVEESSPNCTAAGAHFNPYNTLHGPRTADITLRHVGDFGNVTADDQGSVSIYIVDEIIQLYNATQSILNRTAVVHLLRDDGGAGGFSDSNSTGNAGPRIICGLIKLDYTDAPTTTTITTETTAITSEPTTITSEPTTESNATTITTETSESTTESDSTEFDSTASSTPMSPPTDPPTTPSTGLKIQPMILAVIMAMIIIFH